MGLLRKLFSSSRKSRSGFVRDKRGLGIAEALPSSLLSSANAPSRLVAEVSSLNAEGRYGDSLAVIGHALMMAPDDPELLFAKGSTLYEWGRFREARDVLLRAEASALNITSLYLQLGWTCLSLGNSAEGETWMRKAVLAEPDGWEAHFGLGAALQAAGRLDEAVASLEAGLERNPNHFETAVLLGGCKLNQENPGAAEAFFRRAIAVNGDRADVWVNLAVAVCRQGRIQDARGAIARAEGLEGTIGAELGDLAILGETFKDAGYLQAALALYERSLPQWPSMAGHFNYAHALLTSGRLAEGWNHYEFRWLGEPFLSLRPSYGRPTWSGQDLSGKTILLRAEQGFGDTIQFLRYAPRLKMMGATVVLHVIKGLADVARGCPGIDLVWEDGEMLPSVDFYIHLMSLARVFGTDIDSIPNAIPYLNVEPARVEQWAIRLGPDRRPKVGIAWAGSHVHLRDRYRSMSLHALSVLGDLKEVRFISLQKGAAAEARGSAPVLPLVDLDSELKDFGDTEAVISQLDLVISVDTAVAHLAGALGKPVWVMVAEPADWRWLVDREDSPWYPTMRLFRQKRRGDWDEVVARVKVALQEWLRGDHTHHAASAGKFAPAVQEPTRPKVLSLGVASRVRPGFCAVAETRVGILEYLPDLDPVGKSIDWYGEYLQPELDLIEELIRPGDTVLEVSAGIGVHAVFLAKTIGDAGHLFLYERRHLQQRILRTNLGANRASNVTVMRRMSGCPHEHGAVVPAQGPVPVDPDSDTVTETLDELQLERLNLLKVNEDDVSPRDVLSGAGDTLWRLRPMLFLAARDETALHDLSNYANEFSYRRWRFETPLFNRGNFNRRENDIFGGRSALALVAVPEEFNVDRALHRYVELR